MWDSFHYLSGALNGVPVACEWVECTFLSYWLQLGTKQRTLACRSLGEKGQNFTVHLATLTMLLHRAAAMVECPRSLKWKQSSEKKVVSGSPS